MKLARSVAASAILLIGAMSLQASAASKPQIEDPVGDSNFVNDQGTGDGSFGDQTQADAGTVSDITNITFSNDAKNLIVMLGTEAPPPALTGIGFRVRVNPDGTGGTYCIMIDAYFSGANNTLTGPVGHVHDLCAGGDPVPIEVLGTQLVIPRSTSDAFGKGATLTAPQAQSFLYSGAHPTGVVGPYADTTKVGTDFKFKR